MVSSLPNPQESFKPEAEAEPAKKIRGYEFLNPSLTNASLAMIGQAEATRDLLSRGLLSKSAFTQVKEPRYIEASLDFLDSQGLVESDENHVRLTEEGVRLAKDFAAIQQSVKNYEAISELLKGALEWEHDAERIMPALQKLITNIEAASPRDLEALLPAAVSFFHEKKIRNGKEESCAVLLADSKSVDAAEIIDGKNLDEAIAFAQVLIKMGILERDIINLKATERGKKVFKLGGYAELIMSYYKKFQEMGPLMEGELTYGLNGDVNRDAELNARASNGILNIKVAPYITSALKENEVLTERLGREGAFIDYGSGGGDMLMQTAENGPQTIKKLFGIDVNPAAVEEAESLVDDVGLGDRINFVAGSIADSSSLEEVKTKMTNGKELGAVASINFILHDIGPDLSRQFLKNHASVFGDAPLIITETFLMPPEVIRAHPNYQAASFQFMHKASGQHLYKESELRSLLEECGYEILSEKTHSSMPGENPNERHTSIATWIVQHKED